MDTLGAFEDLRPGERPAGRIESFDRRSCRLVIELSGGGTIAALITTQTWVEGGDESHHARRQLRKWYRLNHLEPDEPHGWHRGPTGSIADLRPGAVVEDAVVVLRDGRALFAKIELTG